MRSANDWRLAADAAQKNISNLISSLEELKRGQHLMADALIALLAERDQLRDWLATRQEERAALRREGNRQP